MADNGSGSAGVGIGSAGIGVIAAKVQQRLWSSHTAIAVARDLAGAGGEGADGDLRVAFEDPATFDGVRRLLTEASGAEYLQLRGVERTRQTHAGPFAVARNTAGEVVAFQFLNESDDYDSLERSAPGMFPRLADDEVLTRPVHCFPEWRSRANETRMLLATAALLAGRGKRRALVYVDVSNADELQAFREAGYVPSGDERVDRFRLGRYSTVFRPLSRSTRAAWDSTTR